MNRINNDNMSSVLDKMIAEMEGKTDGDLNTFHSESEALLGYIGPDAEYSCLLLLFWGLMATMYKTGYSEYSQPACKVAFSAINELMYRKDPTAAKDLIQFTRDDLFIIYLEDRSLYYTIVNEFYLTIYGGYPNFYKNGYVNIYNVVNGLDDSGYMDADYIYIAAWCAEQALAIYNAAGNTDGNDLALYQTMKDMYFTFTSFANQGYGYETYNKPKEKKLYMSALGKPPGFNINSDDKLRRRPIWAAMAYATADASGEYKWRMQVMKILHEDALCLPPREDEQRIIDRRKKQSHRKIAALVIIGVVIVALLFMFKAHPIISSIIIGLIAIAILDQGASSSYGTNIWFVGHYYTGPAYWLGGRWR